MVLIIAPADVTFVVSVISADASIPFSLVLSLSVIIEPEPAEVISLNAVALLVVYTPFVTVAELPLISPIIVFENVLEPPIVWFPVVITPPAFITFVFDTIVCCWAVDVVKVPDETSRVLPELIEVVVGKDNVTFAFSEPELDTLISLEVPAIVAM